MTQDATDDVQGFECDDCGATFDRQQSLIAHTASCDPEAKHRDENWLRDAYERHRTLQQVADEAGCSEAAVIRWMDRFGIERRPKAEALREAHRVERATFCATERGYEKWRQREGDKQWSVYVHRLAAVAWFGWDSVVDREIHHKNDIKWDNREDNFEPLTPHEHRKLHGGQGNRAESD